MPTGIRNKDHDPIELSLLAAADYCGTDDLDLYSSECRVERTSRLRSPGGGAANGPHFYLWHEAVNKQI